MSRARRIRTVGVGGAVGVAAYVLALRPWQLHWGATRDEVRRALPGDVLVPHPFVETTRAITIRASRADVWPWLVQLGYDRAGFYSYAWLENLIGLDIENADRIVPGFQQLGVGDGIMLGPEAPLRVVRMHPGEFVVGYRFQHPFTGREVDPKAKHSTYFAWTWAFVLEEFDASTTRLIVRARGDYRPHLLAPAIYLVLEPIHFLMERKVLLGIRERAEQTWREEARSDEIREGAAATQT